MPPLDRAARPGRVAEPVVPALLFHPGSTLPARGGATNKTSALGPVRPGTRSGQSRQALAGPRQGPAVRGVEEAAHALSRRVADRPGPRRRVRVERHGEVVARAVV